MVDALDAVDEGRTLHPRAEVAHEGQDRDRTTGSPRQRHDTAEDVERERGSGRRVMEKEKGVIEIHGGYPSPPASPSTRGGTVTAPIPTPTTATPMFSETVLIVDGMCCASEEPVVRKALRIPGVDRVDVVVVTRTVTVRHDATVTPTILTHALQRVGLPGVVKSRTARSLEKSLRSSIWRTVPWRIVLAAICMVVAYCSYLPDPPHREAKYLVYAALGAVALLGPVIFYRAFKSLRALRFDVNVLMSCGVIGALGLLEFLEAGAILLLFAGAQWLEGRALMGATRALEAVAALAAEDAVLVDGSVVSPEEVTPGMCLLIRPGARVPVDGVVAGEDDEVVGIPEKIHHLHHYPQQQEQEREQSEDYLRRSSEKSSLASEENAPPDGETDADIDAVEEEGTGTTTGTGGGVTEHPIGSSSSSLSSAVFESTFPSPSPSSLRGSGWPVDESMLTGESRAVVKRRGDLLVAGTVYVGQITFVMSATARVGDSAVARLARLVEEASGKKSRHEVVIEVFARWYTPLVLVSAVLVASVGSGVQPEQWREWVYLALVLLVTACPCAMVIATPVTNVCALARAARMGVLIKGGEFIEGLARAHVVCLDKTGTLTEGQFQVRETYREGEVDDTTNPMDDHHHDQHDHHHHHHDHGPATATATTTTRTTSTSMTLTPRADIWGWVAAIEDHSPHPMAHALVQYAHRQGARRPPARLVSGVRLLPGRGVEGKVGPRVVAVGNAALADQWGLTQTTRQPWNDRHVDWETRGLTVAWVAQRPLPHLTKDPLYEEEKEEEEEEEEEKEEEKEETDATLSSKTPYVVDVGEPPPKMCCAHGTCGTNTSKTNVSNTEGGQGMSRAWRVEMLVGVSDMVRASAAKAVGSLRAMRVTVAMVTGDNVHVARQVARLVGIADEHVHAGLLPREKVDTVAAYGVGVGVGGDGDGDGGTARDDLSAVEGISGAKKGKSRRPRWRTIHVGDGVNDAPALAAAGVGVALGAAASAVAMETADVAILSSDLGLLPLVMQMCRRCVLTVYGNLLFSLLVKVAALVLASMRMLPLWAAVLGDVGSSLVVVLVGMSLLVWRPKAGLAGGKGTQECGSHVNMGRGGDGEVGDAPNVVDVGEPPPKMCCAHGTCGTERREGGAGPRAGDQHLRDRDLASGAGV